MKHLSTGKWNFILLTTLVENCFKYNKKGYEHNLEKNFGRNLELSDDVTTNLELSDDATTWAAHGS